MTRADRQTAHLPAAQRAIRHAEAPPSLLTWRIPPDPPRSLYRRASAYRARTIAPMRTVPQPRLRLPRALRLGAQVAPRDASILLGFSPRAGRVSPDRTRSSSS